MSVPAAYMRFPTQVSHIKCSGSGERGSGERGNAQFRKKIYPLPREETRFLGKIRGTTALHDIIEKQNMIVRILYSY